MNDRVLLSFLGTNKYSETTYTWHASNCRTPFITCAVNEFFKPHRIVVAMTEDAERANGNTLRECLPILEKTPIPTGANEHELWEMFSVIADAVPADAKLIIDVTHGLRSQPLIGLAIAVYLRTAKKVHIEKIVYGAFEARDKETNSTPVFDLTAFLELMDWVREFEDFQRFGNANALRKHLGDLHNNAANHAANVGYYPQALEEIGKKLGTLTDALALVRPRQVIQSAKNIQPTIAAASRDAAKYPQARPLAALLELLPGITQAFTSPDDNLFSPQGFRAQAAMIRFYLETKQYTQAVTLAHEAFISKWLVSNDDDPASFKNREAHKENFKQSVLNRGSSMSKNFPEREKIITQGEELRRLRNDLNHALDERTAKEAIEKTTKLVSQVIPFIES